MNIFCIMFTSVVILIFIGVVSVVSDEETTQWPDAYGKAHRVQSVNPGSARQIFGSGSLRPSISAGTNVQLIGQQQQHIIPSQFPKPPGNPVAYPDDHKAHKPYLPHGILTTEPLYPGIPPGVVPQYDPSYRVIGGVRVPNGINPMTHAMAGVGRDNIYGVREMGERHGDFIVGHRNSERYGMQPNHGHDRVFVPQNSLINEEGHLLTPNDGAGQECQIYCEAWEWLCPVSCVCVSKENRCDKIQQCENGEDEVDCEGPHEDIIAKIEEQCESTGLHTMCPKTYRCIAKDWLCDGDDDCGDYSDETHCGARNNCTEDQFECRNGFCIQKSWICDGDNDCKDDSDEANCTKVACTSEQFQCTDGYCVSLSFHCDGEPDCIDGSDELNCQTPMASCPENEFKCRGGMGGAGGPGGRCVLERFRCDGDNDCGDWSDEEGCPKKPSSCTSSEFKCDDGNCVPNRWKCDGEQDCDGGEDEKDCGHIDSSKPKTCGIDEYTCQSGRCILNNWLCDGYSDCSKGEDEIDCEIKCDAGQFLCPAKKNTTILKICVHQKHVCDGHNDCPNREDELNCPKMKPCPLNSKCEQICVTTSDGYDECGCRVGFILHENKYNCTDIDECQYLANPVCSQKCENTLGSFICSCEIGYILRPDLRTCKALGGAVQLIMANRGDIRQVTLSNNRYTSMVKGLHNAIAVDFHYKKGLLFWSDVSTDLIKMAYINGSRIRDVIRWGLESPGGIAVDWVHDLIFWTDSGTMRIEVANFQGTLRAVIAARDLEKPRAIVVHPGEAFVFWTEWGPNPRIERSYMDGSERITIISKGVFWPNGLTIDYPAKRIYWADAKHHVIESSNFDGSHRTKILSTHLPHPFALTIFEDTMYWTDWNTKSISAANKNTGNEFRNVHEGLHFPMDIHSYHPARQPTFPDRCMKDRRGMRGGCSHLCLPNKNNRRCGCPIGLTLKEDQKTCNSVPDKLLLVARRKDIRLRQLNTKSSHYEVDMIVPLDGLKSTVALDWCSKLDYIYWTDVERSTINRAHLNGSNQQSIVHSNLESPAGLALDWVTDKLYWTDPGTNRIEVASADGNQRALLIWQNLEKPRDIVVDPLSGLLFWSDWGTRPMIERAGMDGTKRKVIVSENLQWPNGLAIDQSTNKLYFVDGGTKTLEYINFDGTGRNTLIKTGLSHPFGLDVNDNKVFWTDWDTKSVQMADKLTGRNRKAIITNTSDLMDIRVFHRSRRIVQNPCNSLNGGCSHLCLLNPDGFSCACPIGVKLTEDLKTCHKGPSKYIIFARRSDIRQISLDIDHLVDVVLPFPAISSATSIDVDLRTGTVYWSDNIEDAIMKASPDGTNIRQVIAESLDSVDGHAIDSVGGKIYWTDAGRRTIEVSDLSGVNRHILFWKDLESPRGITLDYDEGLLFWTDWGTISKIEKSYMNGKYRTRIVLVNLGWPNGIALDLPAKRIYWTDAKLHQIESCDYNGRNRRLILSSLKHPYGIAVGSEDVYWTDWNTRALHALTKSNPLQQRIIRSNMDYPMDVKIIIENATLPDNVCGKNNGGCSHLCLRKPDGFSCACPIGINLKEKSLTTCESVPKNYLIVALRSGIGRISLDTEDLMDVVLPITGVHGSVVLDYHYNKSILFYADVNLDIIRSVDLKNVSNTKTIASTGLNTPNGIAVDWLADNIYWSDTGVSAIEVARLDGSSRKAIIKEDLNDPRSLILYPKRGYLFWSDWGNSPRIERCLLDGSERKIIVNNNLGFPTGLSVDFSSRRLYWADALQDRIEMTDFDGKSRKLVIPHTAHPFGVTLHDNYIYWTDWFNKTIFRANMATTSQIDEVRHGLRGALDIRAVSAKRQPYDWNPCMSDNGGCSHLCLFKWKSYICGCPDKPDNKICKLEPAFIVPLRSDDASEYTDESTPGIVQDYDENTDETTTQERIVIVASGIVSVLLIIVVIAILVLVINSKRKKKKRTSRGSSRSVLTFANPNYNVADGTPMEPKTTIWKRFKYDKSHDRVYEERNLTAETASSSLIIPSPSPMSSPSAGLPLSTIT